MATVNLKLNSKKNPANIYIRFVNGKMIDIERPTGIFVNPGNWDFKNQKIKNVIEVTNRDKINTDLSKLKIFILDEYNLDFLTGAIIDGIWLTNTISKFQNRPKGEIKKANLAINVYLSDYAQNWLNTKAPKHKVSANKYMDERTIGHYQQVLDNFVDFQGKNKIALKNITGEVLDSFSEYLTEKQGYSSSTSMRKLSRIKFFCERAEEDNLEVNKNYKMRVFVSKEKTNYKHPYLNETEINKIFKYDFSHDPTLDNVRDNLIIGLWTGLRISDFLTRLDISNFEDGFIEITPDKTETYGINVSIPIHWMIDSILKKRNGQLPKKISEQKFNEYIKIIGQIVEIDNEIFGGIVKIDEETKKKRKAIGIYKKYLLITSHICRRSFATNLFGKVPNKVIMDVAGWKSEKQMFEYIKQTNRESAIILKEHYNNYYQENSKN